MISHVAKPQIRKLHDLAFYGEMPGLGPIIPPVVGVQDHNALSIGWNRDDSLGIHGAVPI